MVVSHPETTIFMFWMKVICLVSMKMWVQIIPVGGLKASFEDWVDLSGGAKHLL